MFILFKICCIAVIVSLSVSGVLLVIVVIAAGVGCLVGYRRLRLMRADKASEKILKDLEERQSSIISGNGQ